MFVIPGFIISLVTFPGVIVHELAHQIFCMLMKVPVYDVKYFQLKNPAGYVLHERSERPGANILISIGPFIVNTLLGAIIMLPVSIRLVQLNYRDPLTIILAWIGISILINSFPSTGDAKSLITDVLKNKEVSILFRVIVAPIIFLIYIGAIGSAIWLDLLYAIVITVLEGTIIAKMFL